MKRTDPHRKGAIIPANYHYVTSYYLGSTNQRPYGVEVVKKLSPFFQGSHAGHCDACDASFSYGDVWLHVLTGEHIHLGQDCAYKYGLLADRSEFELGLKRQQEAAAVAIRRAQNEERRQGFLASHPGLEEDLGLSDKHNIIASIRNQFMQIGTLSDKQVALVHTLASEVRNPKPGEEPERLAEVPEGKQHVEGRVLTCKSYDNPYAYGHTTLKMLVLVTCPDGSTWKCFGSVPRGVLDDPHEGCLKGYVVSFDATLTRKELGFGYFSRPTNGKIVGGQSCQS